MSDLLNSASLVLIPSGYKEDTVYSVVPSDGSGDLSFTRASNGTRVNSAGLVEVCPWNLLQYSEILDNGVWTKENATITANGTTAPNGTTTADLITSTSTSFSDIIQSTSQIAGQQYTFSCYGKKGNSDWIILRLTFADGAPFVWFNINSGTIGTINSGLTASIESVGNGWYRCSITGVASATPPASRIDVWLANANSSFSPNIGNSAYIWGAQLNIGSTAKPYFPTTDRLNVPRLTYQNGGGGCPSLLLEKQSTNVLQYSEQLDNAFYTKFNSSISANVTTSPDGTTNADKLIANATNDTHGFYAEIISASAGTYTQSVFVKAGEYNFACLRLSTDSDTKRYAVVLNLTTGAITATDSFGSPTNTSSKVDNLGNGWFRLSVTAQHTTGIIYPTFAVSSTAVPTFSSSLPRFTGNGTSGVFIWGAQLEASSYPTSYIPTTSSSATRVADACYKTGISSLIGQTEGTIFWDVSNVFQTSGDGARLFIYTDGNNFILISPYANTLRILIVSSGTAFDNFISISGTSLKIAVAYKANDYKFYVNGVSVGTPTATSVPAMNSIGIVNDSSGSAVTSQSETKQLILFKTRLTNTQLAQLTA